MNASSGTELAQQEIPVERRATPALLAGIEVLVDIDERIGKLRERIAELEATREEERAKLAKKVEPGWWKIGEFTLRRTQVTPRPSIDAWKAIEENAIAEDVLRPYMKASRPFERWTIKRRRKARVSA